MPPGTCLLPARMWPHPAFLPGLSSSEEDGLRRLARSLVEGWRGAESLAPEQGVESRHRVLRNKASYQKVSHRHGERERRK